MSKENTAIISIHRYNELRDLEKGLEENKFIIYHTSNFYTNSYYEYFSKNEFKDKIIDIHKEETDGLEKEKLKLEKQVKTLEAKLKKEEGKRRHWWNKKD